MAFYNYGDSLVIVLGSSVVICTESDTKAIYTASTAILASALEPSTGHVAITGADKSLAMFTLASPDSATTCTLQKKGSAMTWTPFPGAVPAPLAVVGDRTGGIWAAGVPGLSEPRAIGGHTATLVTAATTVVASGTPYLVTADMEGKIRLARSPDVFQVRSYGLGHTACVRALLSTGTPGELLSLGDDGTLRQWGVPSGALARTVDLPVDTSARDDELAKGAIAATGPVGLPKDTRGETGVHLCAVSSHAGSDSTLVAIGQLEANALYIARVPSDHAAAAVTHSVELPCPAVATGWLSDQLCVCCCADDDAVHTVWVAAGADGWHVLDAAPGSGLAGQAHAWLTSADGVAAVQTWASAANDLEEVIQGCEMIARRTRHDRSAAEA